MENVNPDRLSEQQLQEVYVNCVKLSAENKITVNNTWDTRLIENLEDLVKPMRSDEGQVNFQRASCTIDAGVKIYSYRVDSIANEVMKMLGGGLQNDQADDVAGEDGTQGDAAPKKSRRKQAEVNPEATLKELEDITLKDVGRQHGNDPLFHKMSAQFDAGGPTGLLLYNLPVGESCSIQFDSNLPFDAPSATTNYQQPKCFNLRDLHGTMQELSTQTNSTTLSQGLDVLLDMLGQPATEEHIAQNEALMQAALQTAASRGAYAPTIDAVPAVDAMEGSMLHAASQPDALADTAAAGALPLYDFGDEGFAGYDGFDDFGGDDGASVGGDWGEESALHSAMPSGVAGDNMPPSSPFQGGLSIAPDTSEWLMADLTNSTAPNGSSLWAGTSHWRFRKPPQPTAVSRGQDKNKRKKAKTSAAFTFLNMPADVHVDLAPDSEISLKTMTTANTLTSEEQLRGYDPARLAHYFLLPEATIGGPRRGPAGTGANAGESYDVGGAAAAFGGDSDIDDDFGRGTWGPPADDDWTDGQTDSVDGSRLQLVDMPVRTDKIQITYARRSKQVDVRALKETLWHQAVEAAGPEPSQKATLEFSDLVASIPEHNPAGSLPDLSVHLCFICLLHLANEHGLVIKGTEQLDQLHVSNVVTA